MYSLMFGSSDNKIHFIEAAHEVMSIVEFDMDGTIISANKNFLELMGYSLVELKGKHHSVLVDEEHRDTKEYDEFWQKLRNGETQSAEFRRTRKNGDSVWLYAHYYPMFDIYGRPFKIIKFANNVTKIKRTVEALKEREIQISAILNTTVDGMITINQFGIIQSFNPACEKIFGYKAEEVIGQNVKVLMPEPYHSEHDTYLHNYHKTGKEKIIGIGREVEGRRKDGRIFPLELSVANASFEEKILYSGIVRDITERKELDRMKSEFISTVSHELRTPLTSIRGSLGLITGTMSKDLPDKANKLLEIAYKNCKSLILLINDLLDIDKIAAGKMRFNTTIEQLSSLIQRCVDSSIPFADKYHVGINLSPIPKDINIEVDAERFRQAFSNLFSNAIKFSDRGSEVKVYTSADRGKIRIFIEDTGSGIPEEFKNNIFEKFSQANSSATRIKGGTGLGLHITKKIVEYMNGSIGFKSKAEQGTIFWIEFDIVNEVGKNRYVKKSEPVASINTELKVGKILICEDDSDIVTILKMQIEQAGYSADVAYSIAEARNKLLTNEYAAMTLDLIFTMGSGLRFISELRENKKTENLPIIVVSIVAMDGKAMINQSTMGMIDWLEKPIDEQKLKNSLDKAVAKKTISKPTVLHIEDNEDYSRILASALGDNVRLINAPTIKEAKNLLLQENFALVVLDVELPDGSGISMLEEIHDADGRPIPVIILSGQEINKDINKNVVNSLLKLQISDVKIADTIMSYVSNKTEHL